MTQPTFNSTSLTSVILGFCVAVLGIIVFFQGLVISSFIGHQNEQLTNMLSGGQQQLATQQQVSQQNIAFINDVAAYAQQSGDSNVVAMLNRVGISFQQQPAPGAAAPAAAPAPAAGS
jgi:hypothetical protein